MGVRLLTHERSQRTEMRDLRDGQLAIVLDSNYKDTIVQRNGNNATAIGKSCGNGWTDVHKNTLLVRILEAGELIEIEPSNEL